MEHEPPLLLCVASGTGVTNQRPHGVQSVVAHVHAVYITGYCWYFEEHCCCESCRDRESTVGFRRHERRSSFTAHASGNSSPNFAISLCQGGVVSGCKRQNLKTTSRHDPAFACCSTALGKHSLTHNAPSKMRGLCGANRKVPTTQQDNVLLPIERARPTTHVPGARRDPSARRRTQRRTPTQGRCLTGKSRSGGSAPQGFLRGRASWTEPPAGEYNESADNKKRNRGRWNVGASLLMITLKYDPWP